MKLEDQVTSLELSKKLKELGVRQESYFYHYNDPYNDSEPDWVITQWEDYNIEYRDTNAYPAYSAFTASELGEMLPTILDNTDRLQLGWAKDIADDAKVRWKLCYCIPSIEYEYRQYFEDKNEANARAKMLIHLIEQGLVKG